MRELLEEIIESYQWMSVQQAHQIASYRWNNMTNEQRFEYLEEISRRKEEKRKKWSYAMFIVVYLFIKHIARLNSEDLHTLYISLLAQKMQKEAMDNIQELNQEKESYYKKYGRWYDKFISYIK